MNQTAHTNTSLMGALCDGRLGKLKQINHLSKWKVAQCPQCGATQVTRARDKLICMRCGKQSRFRIDGKWHVKIVEHTNDQQRAIRICKEHKMITRTKHERDI